jgi:hypothetical protein
MDNEIKNMIRETREDTEENKVLRKKLAAVKEGKGELRKELEAVRAKMRGSEGKWQVKEAD